MPVLWQAVRGQEPFAAPHICIELPLLRKFTHHYFRIQLTVVIMSKTVYTKDEMRRALAAGERTIIAKGELAQEIRNKSKRSKGAKIGGGILAVGGILAAPFTGGTSLAATAAGLTIGTITISVAELAILVGGAVAITAIVKGCKNVTFNPDGSVTMEF